MLLRSTLDPSLEKLERGIDLKRLRYFIAVCDHGGISKAANAIGIAQPALTRQIKILEAQVGRPLINRSGRGVEPSRPGRYILDRSREHIDSLDNLLRGVRDAFPVAPERFVLGVCSSVVSQILRECADHIREQLPHVALSIVQASSADLQRLIDCGHLDSAVTYRLGAQQTVADLLIERFELVRPAGPTAKARKWPLARVADLKLVLPSKSNEDRIAIDRIFNERRIELRPFLELDSLDAILLVLAQDGSDFASILPYYSVATSTEAKRLRRDEIGDPPINRAICLLAPTEPRSVAIVELVSVHIRNAIAKLGSKLD